MVIDRSKARIRKSGWSFVPLRPADDAGAALRDADVDADAELMVFSRGGESRALLLREMSYHHVCQGKLAGIPYLVTF